MACGRSTWTRGVFVWMPSMRVMSESWNTKGLRRAVTTALIVSAAGSFALPASAQVFRPGTEQSLPEPGDGPGPTPDWHWWWHFNKDAYLNLRETIFKGAPTTGGRDFFIGLGERRVERDPTKLSAYELRGQIVPAILAQLEDDGIDEPSNGIVQACLFALAKVGRPGETEGQDSFDEIIVDYLDHDAQSVRERAVVALGILGKEESIGVLTELLKDTRDGQRLVDSTEVPYPMRAFAAYSLGAIGHRTSDFGARRRILRVLVEVLERANFSTRDVEVACMTAFGLVPLENREWEPRPRRVNGNRPPPPDPLESRLGQLRYLVDFLGDFRHRHELVRAHAPIAIARLLGGQDERTREEVAAPMLKILGRYSDARMEIQQSCVLALGQIGNAGEGELDRDILRTLIRFAIDGDQQSDRYAMMALGRIAARQGTEKGSFESASRSMDFLLQQLGPRGESRIRAWAALALGVMMRELADQQLPVPPEPLGELRRALEGCRTPLDIGAYSLALGLARDIESLETLEEKLELFNIEGAKGLVALSMGLVGHNDAVEPLLEILRDSEFRGEQMELIAIALALLDADDRVPVLADLLAVAGSEASRGPIVAALGMTGDRRAIPRLVEILQDPDEYTDGVLVAAITGLGNIADKDRLLWRSVFSANANYTSTPTTLLTAGQGLLDMF